MQDKKEPKLNAKGQIWITKASMSSRLVLCVLCAHLSIEYRLFGLPASLTPTCPFQFMQFSVLHQGISVQALITEKCQASFQLPNPTKWHVAGPYVQSIA